MDIWKQTIKESFDEVGIVATDEQIDIVTSWVEGLHENWRTYTGSEHIPNPILSEVDELKRKIKQLEGERDKIIEGYRKNVATRRGIRTDQVMIDDRGQATYDLIWVEKF